MKKTIFRVALVVVGVGLLAGFAWAQRGPMGMMHGSSPEKMRKFITWKVNDTLDDLKATDAQRTRVLAVKDRLVGDAEAAFAGHEGTHEQMLAQWNSDRPDSVRMHALVDQRIDEMRRLAHEAVDGMLEVHATLTPEQRAKLAAEFQDHLAQHR